MRMVGRWTEIRVGSWLDRVGGDYRREDSREDGVEAVEEEYGIEENGWKEVVC